MCYADCCLFYALDYISISTGNLYRVLHKKIPQRQLLWQAGKFYNRYRLDNFIIHVPAENMGKESKPFFVRFFGSIYFCNLHTVHQLLI